VTDPAIAPAAPLPPAAVPGWRPWLPIAATALAFGLLFAQPFVTLLRDWWYDPEAGHGLLLAPVAIWLAWKSRRDVALEPARAAAVVVLAGSVTLRLASGLAAELFTMRLSMLGALVGLVLFFGGWRRVMAWWLPIALLALSIPLPEVLLNSIAFPLQLQASRMGAALLDARHVSVVLRGNIIQLPGHQLFVTEACSGLRSLTALLSLGVLAGGLWLRLPLSRIVLIALAIPLAVFLNGIRVFLTGFLVYFVSPDIGEGFMHLTQGWLMFVVAFVILGLIAWLVATLEARWLRPS